MYGELRKDIQGRWFWLNQLRILAEDKLGWLDLKGGELGLWSAIQGDQISGVGGPYLNLLSRILAKTRLERPRTHRARLRLREDPEEPALSLRKETVCHRSLLEIPWRFPGGSESRWARRSGLRKVAGSQHPSQEDQCAFEVLSRSHGPRCSLTWEAVWCSALVLKVRPEFRTFQQEVASWGSFSIKCRIWVSVWQTEFHSLDCPKACGPLHAKIQGHLGGPTCSPFSKLLL